MHDFCEFIDACELRDLGYAKSPFNWCNNREGDGRIVECLNYFLTNSLWCDLFPLGSVRHRQVVYSDHYPIWFDTTSTRFARRKSKFFHFKAIWVKDDECSSIIEDVWSSGNDHDESIGKIMNLIPRCGLSLTQWNKTKFGNVQ